MTDRRTALVTGGASGLGAMTARVLARSGFDIAVNYRESREAAESLAKELGAAGARAIITQGDVSRPPEAVALVEATLDALGRMDVLVHAAGPFIRERRPLADLAPDDWRRMLDGNLTSAFHLVRRAVPAMRERRWGRIILFGFAESGQAPAWPGRAAYAAAKAGLVSLARSLALEEAVNGITVNVVCPGDIRAPWKERGIAEARGQDDGRTPIGRPGTGEDVARVIRFLCEDDSEFITGSVIEVTGGLDPLRPRIRQGDGDRG